MFKSSRKISDSLCRGSRKSGGKLGKAETGKNRVRQMCGLRGKKPKNLRELWILFPRQQSVAQDNVPFQREEGEVFTG